MNCSRKAATAFDGPIDDVRSQATKFATLTAGYLAGIGRLPDRSARIAKLEATAQALPAGSKRTEALDRVKYLRGELNALSAGKKLIEPAVTKARSLLSKIFPGQFGQFDPVSLIVATSALIGATALLVGWTKRESRLTSELALDEKKLACVTAGLCPPDLLKKAAGIGGLLGDAKGLLLAGAALYALIAFGPKLLGKR